jgi:hypothetical protein
MVRFQPRPGMDFLWKLLWSRLKALLKMSGPSQNQLGWGRAETRVADGPSIGGLK